MIVSAVIPTWNEAAWLPRVLCSLISHPEVAEVVVADNYSSDQTQSIARSFGCRILPGGRPAIARNRGAAVAKGDILLFADADAIVTTEVITRTLEILRHSDAVAVHFPLAPITSRRFVRFCYALMDSYFQLLSKVGIYQGVGSFLAVKRVAFEQVGGFREELLVGEDVDLFRRLGTIGFVRYERSLRIPVSARRFTIESPVVFAAKTCLWTVLRLTGTRKSWIAYRWVPYPSAIAASERALLEGVRPVERGG